MGKWHELVLRKAQALWAGIRVVLNPLLKILGMLAGHWQPPAWLSSLRQHVSPLSGWAAANAAWVLLATMLAFGAVAVPALTKVDYGAYLQKLKGLQMQVESKFASMQSLQPDAPKKSIADISVTPPPRTPLEGDGKPRPVVLRFNVSAAPLALVGQEAKDISMTPELAGRWVWVSANQLEFTPKEDWPIDVEYHVTLGSKSMAPHVIIDPTVSFRSPAFEMTVSDASFYQDPVQLNLRKAIYEVSFSHPVTPESFEKNISLIADTAAAGLFKNAGDAQKFTVTYDKLRLKATIHSEPLAIPELSASLSLKITAGVTAQRGGNAAGDLYRSLEIPGLYSLDITELKQLVVTGESGEPESILQITTDMDVHEKEMARATEAWLLPVANPDSEDKQQASDWNDPSEISEKVLAASTRIKLNAVPAEREISAGHTFKFVPEPGRYMLVRIKQGLKSAGGYQLGAQRDEIIRMKRSAPELTIMSKGSLLALSGEKKLPLVVRDLPGVRLEIGRLLPQQLQHLVSQSQGDMSKPEFYNGITPDNLTERFEKDIPLSLKPGKTHYETVDFSQYLHSDNADRRGIFLLTVQGYDPKSKQEVQDPHYHPQSQYYGEEGYEGEGEEGEGGEQREVIDPAQMKDHRLVIVTDLGIISKQANDGARDVFVQSISQGNGVANAMVEIWARNGAVLVSKATDAAGVAHLPSVNGFTREKTPVVLVVKKAGDLSYLPLGHDERSLELSRFDVGGLHYGSLPNQIQAYLFSDRGIYRPGDTINIGIVAKASSWAQKLSDLPVEAEVIDARGLVVRREVIKLGAGGMAEFSQSTQDSSPTGNYTINLNLARDSGSTAPGANEAPALRLGTLTVKVQEFMPDRSKVAVKLSNESEEGWVNPKDIKAKVNVQNLFGTPAQNRRIASSLTLTPGYPAFRSYADYVFFDPQRTKEKFQEDIEDKQTDDSGNAELALGLQRYAQATYQMHLLVKAFEPEGGRSVAAEVASLVSDRPYLIGYKTNDDLGYVKRDAVRSVALIAIDPKAKKTGVKGLKLVRVENKVVSVLTKQPNGLYKYESKPKETVLEEMPFVILASGTSLKLVTKTPGNFAYVLRDQDGLELSRISYSVAGEGNISRSLDRNAELQMTLNRKDYSPGDEIEISIRAPYAGSGLITIERDKVYAHKWFTSTSTASLQKITLPKDFEGNGYISVQFARDLASDEIYMSPMSYGVVPFATSLARRTNPLVLTAPAMLKPGQTLKMQLQSKTATRAVVFAVDEGILQVARYQSPDPLKYFFQKRALEVNTQQTLDLILPEFKKLMQSAAPGGDAEGALGKNLNPFKRKRDKPVAYWSGIVEVNGTREFSYEVPESFNGSLRIMAVAINDDTAGMATGKTTVRGDLVLLPNVPVAITPGDQAEIGIGVSNNAKGSGKDAPVTLALSVTGGLEVVGSAQQTLKISERAEGTTKFLVRAKPGAQAQLGSASVIFTAQVKEAKARLSTDVSVRPASAYVTLVQTGLFKGSGQISSQAEMYPNFARNEAAVSGSPWAFTSGLIQYLDVYPHGCTEQITSQVFPAVLLSSQPGLAEELLKQAKAKGAVQAGQPDINKTLTRYLAMVRARQGSDGGFAMWPGGSSDIFPTTYVVSLLLEARDRKLPVPNDVLQRANLYMQNYLARTASEDYYWRSQAQAAYLLTRQGVVTMAALNNLREAHRKIMEKMSNQEYKERWTRDLGLVYLAASYQMLKQEAIADELLKPAYRHMLSGDDYWKHWYWSYYYDPLIHNAELVHMVAKHFPKLIKDIPLNYWERLATVVSERYYQSQSSAMVLLAVDAYETAASQSAAGKVNIEAIDRKGVLKALELPQQLRLSKVAVPYGTAKLKLSNQGDLPLFYSWAESGYERKLPDTAASEGMQIEHEFLDANGKPVAEAALGDEVTVRVRVRSTDRSYLSQVALVDVLPGGLEPVLTSPSDSDDPSTPLWRRRLGGSSSWAIDYADIREDRVVFYGNVSDTMTEVTYKARATNVGDFVVPAAYGEAMYEQKIFARAAAARFKVKPVAK
jgi:uncharacterized protein YfaS (alpha-2-macroglobulin family)